MGKEQNIFQESELLNLTPHIVDAFTKAPLQYILVNLNYTKGKGFLNQRYIPYSDYLSLMIN